VPTTPASIIGHSLPTRLNPGFRNLQSLANRDAVFFPIRLLQLAHANAADAPISFADLARMVGETKQPYNDQQ
jgi:hypothetical protein